MKKNFKFREIPYNYTSFSDKEIALKYLDEEGWNIINNLRDKRVTGRTAKLFFEILGDIFILERNPYIFNDFLENKKKKRKLKKLHKERFNVIRKNSDNPQVEKLLKKFTELDKQFFSNFNKTVKNQQFLFSHLKDVISKENIHFSPFQKVAHVTDASDWRVEYPEVVVYPETVSDIVGLVKSAKNLNLKIIPRGGGTGLTGGSVPVYKNTMIINIEKLRKIKEIETVSENNLNFSVIECEAGVITENITQHCKSKGFIFATDPTSSWASTIAGNISENAGGKKCVMWGTTIDNLYSFKIVNSHGDLLEVKRKNHPHRKIKENDTVIYEISKLHKKKKTEFIKSIELKGTDIRKSGIGKDITNKALGGVPGIQKEGGDGVIVSAKFVLYKPFKFVKTVCLEFFGKNMVNASKAIVSILNMFEKNHISHLTALEHWDEKYGIAINYRNKSDKSKMPIAVIIVDVESDDFENLEKSCLDMENLVKEYDAEGFTAKDDHMRTIFWKDRKNLGAIAKHTNAFKLNEDIVIPIKSLPEFADFVDKLNVKKTLSNNSQIIENIKKYLDKLTDEDFEEDNSFFLTRKNAFLDKIDEINENFIFFSENLEKKGKDILSKFKEISPSDKTVFELIRDEDLIIDIDKTINDDFKKTFHGYDEIFEQYDEIVEERREKKIIIATHMHAGDGNVHVNIPVFSNDYVMMKEAEETAALIMIKTTELDGVISGEHGIGLTKLKFIDQSILDNYADYKKESDPTELFNPGKLKSDFPESKIYTPSLNLLEMEAFILEVSDMKELTSSIAPCVRCGKCKEPCSTSHPSENMFYNPRNKILAVGLIAEAVLYEAQTATNLSFRNFKMLRELSDYCTMCHKCYPPCPVNIDFGNVTLAMKKLLVDRKQKKIKAATALTLFYLKRRGYYFNKIFRYVLLKIAFSSQRVAYRANKPIRKITKKVSPYIYYLLSGKLLKSGEKSVREHLNLKGTNSFFAFKKSDSKIDKNVVYFPGCGSERMFTEISFATLALLYDAGVQVVIPPEYLCCGYPLKANGQMKQAEIKSYENRVIFHKMQDTIGYMNISDVVVSCGTCYEMLTTYQLDNIFPGSNLIDINEYIDREKLYPLINDKNKLYYHEPCHTPLKKQGYEKTFNNLLGTSPVSVPHCCGESGTMATSTPEISYSLRERKKKNFAEHLKKREKATVLTTCPSCVQGLSRIHGKMSISGKSLVVYLAESHLGKHWKRNFIKDVKKNSGVEKIMF